MRNIKTLSEFIKEAYGSNGFFPKSELPIGTFLKLYYRGINYDAGSFYRIISAGHSDYTTFNITGYEMNNLCLSVSDYEIIGTEDFDKDEFKDYCFEIVTEDYIKSLIVEKTRLEVMEFLADHFNKGIENFEDYTPAQLASAYVVRSSGGAFKQLVLIKDETGRTIYTPLMNFPRSKSGHKPVRFD